MTRRNPLKKKCDSKGLVALLFILGIFAVAGTMDYEDAKKSEAEYCDRVHSGIHTNYKKIDCEASHE
jgi:hypothetical protein